MCSLYDVYEYVSYGRDKLGVIICIDGVKMAESLCRKVVSGVAGIINAGAGTNGTLKIASIRRLKNSMEWLCVRCGMRTHVVELWQDHIRNICFSVMK